MFRITFAPHSTIILKDDNQVMSFFSEHINKASVDPSVSLPFWDKVMKHYIWEIFHVVRQTTTAYCRVLPKVDHHI